MRARELATCLKALIPTKRAVFVHGPPGIGKSEIVAQVAADMQADLIDIRAVYFDSVDVRGIPDINGDGLSHWRPPAWLPHDPASRGVLFLDELPQAPPLSMSAFLQLTLDRKVGEYTLPPGWSVLAAGNRVTDRAGAHHLITPLLNRFIHLDLDVNTDDWQAWAIANGIAAPVWSFINYRPSLLFQFDPKTDARSFPTPRSWKFVSDALASTPDEILQPVVSGCVGEGSAMEFIAYMKLFHKLERPDDIAARPTKAKVPSDPSELYALCGALTDFCRELPAAKLSPIVTYALRMPRLHSILLMRDIARVNSQVVTIPEASEWFDKHKELLKT